MSNFSMSQQQHATLLAKKIFNSNNADEVHAFISLNLDVDWMAPYPDETLLVERAFRVINTPDLFVQWWSNVQRQNPITVWSTLPNDKKLASVFLQPAGCYGFKSDLLKADPGTSLDHQNLINQSKSVESALNPTWDKVSSYLKTHNLLSDLVFALDEYRQKNLYLTASTEKEFQALRPTELSPANAMDMYVRLNSHGVGVKNLWYLSAFLEAPWDKWSTEQWRVVVENHNAGILVRALETAAQKYGSYSSTDRPRFEKMMSQIEKFYKKMPNLGLLSLSVAQKDALVLSTVKCNCGDEDIKRSFYRSLGRGLQSVLDQSLSLDPFSSGVVEALIDTTCFRSTMLSIRSLNSLKKDTSPPTTVEQMCQKITAEAAKELSSLKVIDTQTLPMLMTHVAASLPTDKQKVFLESLQESSLYRNQSSEMSLSLLGWSVKGMETAQSDQEKSNWANIYWQSIFSVQVANQHYWLKKIHGLQDFIVPVTCWNQDFENTLMKALGKRKSNDAIQSVLSKMSLVNATAGLTASEEPIKRRSKL